MEKKNTTTKIKWRLGKLPDTDEVSLLVEKGILTKDEAREILFSLETEDTRTEKSLQEEIKFLRELVQKLTTNRSVIIEQIRTIEKPYKQFDWYQPYYTYSTSGTNNALYVGGLSATAGATNAVMNLTSGTGLTTSLNAQNVPSEFTAIKTF